MLHQITRYLALGLSLVFATLVVAQTVVYRAWDVAYAQQLDYQAKLAQADRFNSFPEQLVRRIAVDSTRDPALVEILKKHGIIVRFSTQNTATTAPDKGTSDPQSTTSSTP
ncbi:MAG: hypothetical protein PHD76_12155 [Methylacidiphilales bacterium]|nr:hypothetical protein [Candidatus Methylacidiphilales bacterium]